MTNHIFRLRAVLLVGLLAASACGDDALVNPTFGAQCSAGSLAAGQIKDGAITAASCELPYHFWSGDRTFYDSYSVVLEKGRGYHFLMQSRNDVDAGDGLDALLTLYGKNADGVSVPLAISDDDANGYSGYDSEFYFIAPRSGTFQLVAAAYSASDTGGYRLRMNRCPVVATLDTAGFYGNIDLEESPCVRRSTDTDNLVTPIVLVGVPVDANESVSLTIDSDDFGPVFEGGGPGFDVYANIFNDNTFESGSGDFATLSLSNGNRAGVLTIAVGATDFGAIGRFNLDLTRTPLVSLQAARAPAAALFGAGTIAPRPPKRR